MEAHKKERIAEISRLEQEGKMTEAQKKERDELRYEHIELWSERSKNPSIAVLKETQPEKIAQAKKPAAKKPAAKKTAEKAPAAKKPAAKKPAAKKPAAKKPAAKKPVEKKAE